VLRNLPFCRIKYSAKIYFSAFSDHRKIMVVDGRVAYSGGINLSDEYINIGSKYGHWKDIGFKITGEGVKSYTYMFMEFWNAFSNDMIPHDLVGESFEKEGKGGDGYVLPYYDSPMVDENVSNTFFSEMHYAAERLCVVLHTVSYAW